MSVCYLPLMLMVSLSTETDWLKGEETNVQI